MFFNKPNMQEFTEELIDFVAEKLVRTGKIDPEKPQLVYLHAARVICLAFVSQSFDNFESMEYDEADDKIVFSFGDGQNNVWLSDPSEKKEANEKWPDQIVETLEQAKQRADMQEIMKKFENIMKGN